MIKSSVQSNINIKNYVTTTDLYNSFTLKKRNVRERAGNMHQILALICVSWLKQTSLLYLMHSTLQ